MILTNLAAFMKNSGMRKISSLLLIQAANLVALWRFNLGADNFVTLTAAVIAGIVGGNAFEHHAKSKAEIAKTPPSPR